MKKVLVMAAALVAAVCSAKAEVEFAYDAGAELVSSYIWRGQYNGGLSLQPDLEIGYDGSYSSLRIGAWGNIGASDWMFKKDQGDGTGYTKFMPEIDIVGSFTACGLSVGFNHYYYCDGTSFFNWKSVDDIDAEGGTSTTEVWAGYNFNHFFGSKAGAYINWYTTVAGGDLVYDEAGDPKRAWSSYLEIGYEYCFEDAGVTLGAHVGMSPWKSDLYGNDKFAVTNVSLKINKDWEFERMTLSLFGQGTINPNGIDKTNLFVNAAGDDKLYQQKLNGVIGLGFWF